MTDAPPRVSARLRRALGAVLPFVGFLGIAFALTAGAWHDPSHVWPGPPGDAYKFMDFLAWTPYAIAHAHNPLFMGVIDYPAGVNLTWETAAPLGGVAVWPVSALFGPVAAYNVFILASITLDGWCTYLWLRRHVRSPWAAALAAVVIATGPWTSMHAPQLNLISFWPIPLIFMAAEDLLRGTRRRVVAGLILGVLFGVQLYLAEELAVLAAIALAVGVVATLIVLRSRVRPAIARVVAAGAVAVGTGLVLAAPMLIYQFRGPRRIHGLIQPRNYYVTDLQNLLIPTPSTWAWPHSLTATGIAKWTGLFEATSYIGIALLVVTLYVCIRWWREPLVKVLALTAVGVAILSLGPHLHVGGTDTGIRLPGVIFDHLPGLENLLPVRLSLITALALTLLLAIGLDRTLFSHPLQRVDVAAASALGLVAVASLVSVLPLPTSSVSIPQYFQSGGGASHLPAGTVALVGPYIDDGATTPVVMLWQAQTNFRITLIDALAITADANGNPTFLPENPVRDAFDQIQLDGRLPDESDTLRQNLLATLRSERVGVIIVGPMQNRDLALSFVEWLTGQAPHDTEGVSVWAGLPPV